MVLSVPRMRFEVKVFVHMSVCVIEGEREDYKLRGPMLVCVVKRGEKDR